MIPLLIIFTSNLLTAQYPKITVTSWSHSESYTWDTTSEVPATFANETTLVIPSTIRGIVLTCNATYPIEWNIHHEQLHAKRQTYGRFRTVSLISTTRKSDDIFKPETFVYVSELTMMGDATTLTGNYTCLSAREDEEQLATNMYVFWEGTSPPFLIYAGENRTIVSDKDADLLIIPCKVSRPDISVVLFKNVGTNFTKYPGGNDTVVSEYEPSVGFILSKLNPNTTLGQYRCEANDEGDKDFVFINVISKEMAPKPYEFKNSLRYPAFLTFNANKTQFMCCSNSDKPPKLMHLYCDHPMTCALKKQALVDVENNGKRSADGKCVIFSLFVQASGIMRCSGDGIDLVKEYFFPMGFQFGFRQRNVSIPYYNWDDADSDKMLALAAQYSPMFVGKNVSINCQISKYYFSRGARWMISWKNGTTFVVPEVIQNTTTSGRRSRYTQIFRQNIISITITPDEQMLSVTCFAPVWNTSEWKNKSVTLNVEVPLTPQIGGEQLEIVEWYLNETDKTLSCQTTGKPWPSIRWRKDNQTFHLNLKVTTANGTSNVSIARVSYEHHGIYTCTAMNFAGNVTKTFQVIVSERKSSWSTFGIVLAVIVVIAGLVGSLILVLRLRAQKDTIRHLATAAFKDFENPNHQIISNGNNYEVFPTQPSLGLGLGLGLSEPQIQEKVGPLEHDVGDPPADNGNYQRLH